MRWMSRAIPASLGAKTVSTPKCSSSFSSSHWIHWSREYTPYLRSSLTSPSWRKPQTSMNGHLLPWWHGMLLITDGWYEVIVLLEHDLGDGSTQLYQMHGRQSCMLWKRMQRRWLWFGQHLTSTVQGTVLWLSTRRMMRERISSRVSIMGSHIGCLLAGMDSLEELRDMPRRETVLNSPEPNSSVGGRPTPSAPELVVRLRGTLRFIIRAPTVRYVSFSSFLRCLGQFRLTSQFVAAGGPAPTTGGRSAAYDPPSPAPTGGRSASRPAQAAPCCAPHLAWLALVTLRLVNPAHILPTVPLDTPTLVCDT